MDPLTGTAVKYEMLPWDISPAAAYVRAAQNSTQVVALNLLTVPQCAKLCCAPIAYPTAHQEPPANTVEPPGPVPPCLGTEPMRAWLRY